MIKLASLFQDGAVLQRNMELPVWGKTLPGVIVEIIFDNCISRTRSSSEGEFTAYLPPHDAGGPFELTVKAGGEEQTVTDILVGEVWLASGQSNMSYLLTSDWRTSTNDDDGKEPPGKIQEKQFGEMISDPDRFRFFTVQQNASGAPEKYCNGKWFPMSAEHRGDASAVAAWFGLGLQYQLDVPIGIVVCAWGGSPAEAWTSEEALIAAPATKVLAEDLLRSHYKKAPAYWEYADPQVQDIPIADLPGCEPDSGNQGITKGYADLDFDDSSWKDMLISGSWKEQNIAGNGAVWFRKKITLPAQWVNAPLELEGGSVDKHDITYFNGTEIGRTGAELDTSCFCTQRNYPIDPALAKEGENLIAIRGFSFAYDGAVNGSWFLVNKNTGEKLLLNGIWKACAEYDRGNIAPQPVINVNTQRTTSILFNGMLRPLIPYAMRGVIWYQGENNAASIERAELYRDLLQVMINDWRRRWRLPDMPFLMVQLAGFGTPESFNRESNWACLRESQRLIALHAPNTFMVSAIDIGESNDIHPQNKLDVGKRLAMCALHHIYDFTEIIPAGPEVAKAEISGNTVRLSFCYGEELELRDGDDSFFLAGKDGVFFPADHTVVEDETLVISSSQVSGIAELRYAWANFPPVRLFNKAGFPASSFRLRFDME